MIDSAPKIEDFKLDAYGHLSYVVGWSDEGREDLTEMEIIAKAAEGGLSDEQIKQLSEDSALGDRGDWLACVDFARDGNFVAYHVVVNSDSGGFIDTLEQGLLSLEDARNHLPGLLETWDDIGSEHLVVDGQWYTKQERDENLAAIKRWKEALKRELEDR